MPLKKKSMFKVWPHTGNNLTRCPLQMPTKKLTILESSFFNKQKKVFDAFLEQSKLIQSWSNLNYIKQIILRARESARFKCRIMTANVVKSIVNRKNNHSFYLNFAIEQINCTICIKFDRGRLSISIVSVTKCRHLIE